MKRLTSKSNRLFSQPLKITIENNKVVCKNIENGEILKSITQEGNGGLYNLETDKLNKIYKFYKS